MSHTGRGATPGHRLGGRELAYLALGASVLGTAAIAWSPDVLFGVHAPSLHLVLDSVDASVATLVVFLLVGRFRRNRGWRSLLLALGIGLLVLAPLTGAAVEALEGRVLGVWWTQALRVLASILIASGALVGGRRQVSPAAARRAPAAVVGAALVIGGVLWLLRDRLPVPLVSSPASASAPDLVGHPALLLAHALGGAGFLVAAVALAWWRQVQDEEDELVRWLAPACVLGAFSRVHYILFPSIYSGWLYTGDLFRTGCYLLLLVGAAREISRHWADQPGLAVREDRRRLARELHDGVVQELGYIAAEGRHVEDEVRRDRIVEAARRGLDEARAAVEALDHGEDESFALALHRLADQLTERFGVRITLDLDVSVPVAPAESHALLRIAREAAGNAARHGHAGTIGIGLRRDPAGRHLVVRDDGSGFEASQAKGRGYGLTSMRDRARGLRGDLEVRSAPGEGTRVTVTW